MTQTPSRAVQLIRSLMQIGPLLMVAACGGNGSSSSVTAPGSPTLNSATAGDRQAVLTFTASTSGGAATTYNGDCTATGVTTRSVTGSSSPITVTGMTNGTTYTCGVTAVNSAGSASSASKSVTPVAASSGGSSGGSTSELDTTKLPLGDYLMTTTTPQVGYLYLCSSNAGKFQKGDAGPWFNGTNSGSTTTATTWDLTKKLYVAVTKAATGTLSSTFSVSWPSIGGNGLPGHNTGDFPITDTTLKQYDGNPNSIKSKTIAWGLPSTPTYHDTPSCVGYGAIGVFLTGARLFAATDAVSRDARAWEITDACGGHPSTDAYHYHSLPACGLTADVAGQHSALVGYASDGFGIYGNLGEGGTALKSSDLDKCHGHIHAGAPSSEYHYHTTDDFPYTVGCFRGTAATTD
ncbi:MULTISPECIES: YHYH protein [unclassified Rhizobacter]|uniref:YHYH protein n=1 Tax=unclassified Rhizobacter TaxID=2640088 RepID=UPI000A820C98|nr:MULTISPECIES: YHYH protein [unclassified Rhizobacter]